MWLGTHQLCAYSVAWWPESSSPLFVTHLCSDAFDIPANPVLTLHCHVNTAGERRAGQEVGPGEHKGDKQDDQGREVNEGEGKEGKGGACLDRVLLG